MAKKSSAVLNAKKIASKLKTTKKSKSVERYQAQGQNSPQSKAWTEAGDEGVKAKPIGYRWTTKGAEKVGKTPTSKPTPQDIEKYSGKTFKVRGVSHRYIYIERRVDKSDKSVKAKFKKGGVSQVGRQSPNYSEAMDGQKIAKPVGYRYTDRLAKRLGVDAYKRPTPAHIEKYLGKGVYVEKREDKTDNKPSKKYISLAKGGVNQVGRQYPNYSEDMDGQRIAKPVGYRYTDRLAKRLGVDAYKRPTPAHIEKYLGRGVYKEQRQDKTDYKPSKKYISLAKGGVNQSGRQYPNYSEEMDGQRIAKPVGNRYTDKLAKRLGVNPYSRPTTAHVERYLGEGVYKELREDKTDNKPSKKYISLAHGGDTMARGGAERIANRDAREYSENMIPFMANNLEGKTLSNGDYVVLSYGYYPIWYYCKSDNQWYGNSTKYSVTTSKQMSQSRPTYDAKMLSRADLDQLMLKHTAKFESGGVLDGIFADNVSMQSIGGTSFSTADLTPQMDITNPSF